MQFGITIKMGSYGPVRRLGVAWWQYGLGDEAFSLVPSYLPYHLGDITVLPDKLPSAYNVVFSFTLRVSLRLFLFNVVIPNYYDIALLATICDTIML
jgi:hypothetical protein